MCIPLRKMSRVTCLGNGDAAAAAGGHDACGTLVFLGKDLGLPRREEKRALRDTNDEHTWCTTDSGQLSTGTDFTSRS